MKKSNLLVGLFYTLLGAACFIMVILFDTRLNGLLFTFSGTIMLSGLLTVFKYFYWTADKNKDRYAERLENEQIELHDERKERFRDKSGRYAYILGLIVIAISIIVIWIVKELGIVLNARFFILYLSGYLVFQYIIGIIIFRYLNNNY